MIKKLVNTDKELVNQFSLACSTLKYFMQNYFYIRFFPFFQFPHHNLTMEAAWPGLFVDGNGSYWDVPFSLALDLASTTLDSGASYHLFFNNCAGSPKQYEGQHSDELPPPAALLPGFTAKGVVSLKKNIDLWRSEASMLKMVQPYDIFLSNPHISASWILGENFNIVDIISSL